MRIICAALFMSAIVVPVQAQVFGGDDPIKVTADNAVYEGGLTTLEGNVDVLQGTARIRSDKMKIYRSETDGENSGSLELGAVNRIDAQGSFRYTTPENDVTGNRGIYERSKEIITVTGNVKVKQPSGNTASTDKLIYNVKTETIRFAGNCMGKDCTSRPSIRIEN